MLSESRSDEDVPLRTDPRLVFPEFLPTLRNAVRKSESNFRGSVLNSGLSEAAKESYFRRSTWTFEEFDRRMAGTEEVRDSKKQSAAVNSALLEFNSAMRELRSELLSEIRSTGKEHSDGDLELRLKISDADSFLRENGM